jgi:hypothetical protein
VSASRPEAHASDKLSGGVLFRHSRLQLATNDNPGLASDDDLVLGKRGSQVLPGHGEVQRHRRFVEETRRPDGMTRWDAWVNLTVLAAAAGGRLRDLSRLSIRIAFQKSGGRATTVLASGG